MVTEAEINTVNRRSGLLAIRFWFLIFSSTSHCTHTHIYIYVYIYMYIYICIYIYVYIYIYICIYIYTYTGIYIYVHTSTHTYYIYIYRYVYIAILYAVICIIIYICSYIYIYIYIYISVCVHLVMFPTRCFAKDLDHHVGKRPARLVLRGLSGLWLRGHHAESRGIFGQRGQLRGALERMGRCGTEKITIFNGKITIFNGKIHYTWPFSIATLNYQRVSGWWVGTCFYLFIPYIGNTIFPTDELIFFNNQNVP